jgi:hypothetical protein
VAVARRVLFIVNDPVATGALLSEAFADNGFDIDTFEVVPWGARWAVYDDALRRCWVGASAGNCWPPRMAER